jgi:hypothetical protein
VVPRSPLALACALAILAGAPGAAAADPFLPPAGQVFAGLTGGDEAGAWTAATGKHPPVFQSFVTWGGATAWALRRAETLRARPMLHVSTGTPGHEAITPRGIATGAGDGYLLALGRELAASGHPAYLRLMAEMNGNWNPYCAYAASGHSRGPAHTTRMFRRAWQRTWLILHGGETAAVDRSLGRLGLPAVRGAGTRIARAPVALLWVPQSAGNPDTAANGPRAYWPGARYVDWVGTDFYSRFPNFAGLERLYRAFRGKPFVLGEWALWGRDDPAFVRRLFAWVRTHPRTRMVMYNQGNRAAGPFRLSRYPRAARALRAALGSPRFATLAPEFR